ncbi:MAG: polysaccharide biosynthesis/export family protein [Puniceicoccaceae bacterium]
MAIHLGLLCLLGATASHAQTVPVSGQAGDSLYTLREGDTVQISVFNEPDLSIVQKLDPNGIVIIPLLGRTNIAGRTLRDSETYLQDKFISEEYLINPQITVTIVSYAEQVFYVYGEVNSPGAKSMPNGRQSLDILEAITMAGDLGRYAKRTEVLIRRPIKGENREDRITVNLDTIIRGSRRSENGEDLVLIYPDDIIFVPERRI